MADALAVEPLSASLTPTLVSIAVIALVGTYALPYVFLLITSFKPAADVLQIPPTFLPERISLENYRSIFANASVPGAFFNSIVVAPSRLCWRWCWPCPPPTALRFSESPSAPGSCSSLCRSLDLI